MSKYLKYGEYFLFSIMFVIILIIIVRFLYFNGIGRQEQVKSLLKTIYENEESYYNKHFYFTKDFKIVVPNGTCKYYFYSVYFADNICEGNNIYRNPNKINPFINKNSYLIVAIGNIDSDDTLDIWSLNEKGDLKHIQNDLFR